MKKIIQKWNSTNLIIRILCGLVVGFVLALAFPKASWISTFGTLFVGALKAIAPILVFVLVTGSIAQAKGKFGHKFATVIFLYILSTLVSAAVAVFASFLFQLRLHLQRRKFLRQLPAVLEKFLQHCFKILSQTP